MTLVRLAPQHAAATGVAVFIDPDAPFGGACRDEDPELWWPISAKSLTTIAVAKGICRACPVLDACRDWADRTPDQWAGAVIAGVYRDSSGFPVYDADEAAQAVPARPAVVAEPNPEADDVLVPAVVRLGTARRGRPVEPIRHGTERGERTHRRRGERPCNECRLATNLAQKIRAQQRKAIEAIAS